MQRQTSTSICRGAFSWTGDANGGIGKHAQQMLSKSAGDSEGANTQPNGCGVNYRLALNTKDLEKMKCKRSRQRLMFRSVGTPTDKIILNVKC